MNTCVDFVDEVPGATSVRGENGGAVSVRVGVDDSQSLVQGVDGDDAEDRAEYFLLVALVAGLDVGQDCWSHEVSVGILVNHDIAPVQHAFGALQTNQGH